jgi:hypothetical protein
MHASLLVAIAVAALLPGVAAAQTSVFDHLQCFQIKAAPGTPAPARLTADLRPEQAPPFAVAPGCRVKTKPRLLCIDVAKENLQPSGWTLPVSGTTARDYLCYDVKCPPPAGGLAGDVVTDQFGEHVITTRTTKTLCVPAIHGPAPRPTAAPCGAPGSAQCSDTCPGNYRCLFVPETFDLVGVPGIPIDIPGTNDCRCVPPELACGTSSGSLCTTVGPQLLCPVAGDLCFSNPAEGCGCVNPDIVCGSVHCPSGTVCCNPVRSICVPPGLACTQ